MKISVIAFTDKGAALGETICLGFPEEETDLTNRHAQDPKERESLQQWAEKRFQEKTAIVVIGACGIAVRMIAPFVESKVSDSPVIVVDEAGQFVIPLLSGHLGGANALAEKISKQIGAVPVVTTATDVRETFSPDLFAKQNGLTIQNKEGIARISSKILDNQMVDIVISRDFTELSHGILRLKPKEYILGVGCKKGKTYQELAAFIDRQLQELGIESSDIRQIASIDLKSREEAILRWAACNRVPFVTYSAEQLKKVEGTFTESAFVEKTTGVSNVCERAAMAAAGENGQLVRRKQAENGMTLAVAKCDWKFEPTKQKGYRIDEA